MNGQASTTEDYIPLSTNARGAHFQQHTPPRSPTDTHDHYHSEEIHDDNDADDAELSQLLLYSPSPSSHHFATERRRSSSSAKKRRRVQVLLIYLGLAMGAGVLLGALVRGRRVERYREAVGAGWKYVVGTEEGPGKEEEGERWGGTEVYLKSGNATNGFRENLRPEWTYVTTWNSAGMTNVFEGYCNLIYLALITQRIPIIPPLVPSPSHLGFNKPLPMIDFGEVFDVARLQRAIRSPILEWKDVKRARYGEPWAVSDPAVEGVVQEELGCWSTNQVVRGRFPHRTSLETFLKLDVAYTPVPLSVALPRFPDQSTFWGLAYLTFDEGRRTAFTHDKDVVPGSTLHSKSKVEPDVHLACFDDLYFTNAVDGFEWERDVSPGWRFVGVHVRWNGWIEDVVREMVKRTLGMPTSAEVPPFIAVHIRRDDFDSGFCRSHPEAECHPPLTVFRNRVRQVKRALADKFGPVTKLGNVHDVIVTSDENNATWWAEVRRMGWIYIDHEEERTVERYGKWYPAIFDAVVQSMSIGFVGTQRSTMSRVAALR
ncbi:hypothetical protein FRB90_004237, partial [Tulasnella sp. 427]